VQTPPEIVYEGMSPSMSVQTRVEEEIAKLERFFGRITACRVVIDAPGHRRRHGGLYSARVHLSLPAGQEVVSSRNPPADHAHEDALVAVRDAFRAAGRKLQDATRELQGNVKHHESPNIAIVSKLFPSDGYGFLETPDGREIYFHRNSVIEETFDRIEVGQSVTYAEEDGEKGPQASTVHILGKHGLLFGEGT